MSATDDGEEPTVEDVLASLTNGFTNLSESHGDLTATVEELQATVEMQADLLARVLELVADGEGVSDDALAAAYRAGAEDGAGKAVEKVTGLAPGDLPDDGAGAGGGPDHPPRGFQ